MPPVEFSVDLDKHAGLFVVPMPTYPDIVPPFKGRYFEPVEAVQSPYIEALKAEYLQEEERLRAEWVVGRTGAISNELWHRYALVDEAKAAYFADRVLQSSVMNEDLLNVLSGEQLDKNPSLAVDNLLSQAEKHATLFCLRAACLIKAGQICEEYGKNEEACRLYLAVIACTQEKRAGVEWDRPQIRGDSSAYMRKARTRFEAVDVPVKTENSGLFNPLNSSQQRLMRHLIHKFSLHSHEEHLVGMAQNAICFSKHKGDVPIGGSKLGGLPDVPEGWEWPEELEFLAQFNLEEIAPYDWNEVLPSKGILSFFLEEISWWNGRPRCRVFFFDTEPEQLRRADTPPGFLPRNATDDLSELKIYNTVSVAPHNVIDFDPWGDHPRDEVKWTSQWREDNEDALSTLKDELDSTWGEQLLGSAALNNAYHKSITEKEWTMLFLMDSSDDVGTAFCDGGVVFFLIRNEDLKARRFDRIEIASRP